MSHASLRHLVLAPIAVLFTEEEEAVIMVVGMVELVSGVSVAF